MKLIVKCGFLLNGCKNPINCNNDNHKFSYFAESLVTKNGYLLLDEINFDKNLGNGRKIVLNIPKNMINPKMSECGSYIYYFNNLKKQLIWDCKKMEIISE